MFENSIGIDKLNKNTTEEFVLNSGVLLSQEIDVSSLVEIIIIILATIIIILCLIYLCKQNICDLFCRRYTSRYTTNEGN